MKVLDNGSVHIYGAEDECPHKPGDEELWQESVVLYLWDMEQKVYVFLRMSQEPNRGPGYTTVWLNVWTPQHVYKHTDDAIPMKAGDVTKTSINAGDGLCRYEYDGKHHWAVNDGEVEVRLAMQDHHPGFGYYVAGNGSLVTETAKNHIEATGHITGSVRVKGKTYQVAGTGWRDHSWGVRNWRGVLVHRFFPAMFGREFNFFGITFVGMDGKMARLGLVIRDDTVMATKDFDILAYMDEDGVSNRGGRVTLRLDGKTHVMEFELLGKCAISLHQDCPCVDGMCKVTMGDQVGVGVAETTHRAQGGNLRPAVFSHSTGILENGIFAA